MAAAAPRQQPPHNYGELYSRTPNALKGNYAELMDMFRTHGADPPTSDVLYQHILQSDGLLIPQVYLILTGGGPNEEESSTIYCIHRPRRYKRHPVRASPWDNQAFAFLHDVLPGNFVQMVEFRQNFLSTCPPQQVHTMAQTKALEDTLPVDQVLLSPPAAGAPDTDTVTTRFCIPVPYPYIHLVLNRPLTPRQAWTQLGGAILNENREQELQPLMDWLRCALTATLTNAGAVTNPVNTHGGFQTTFPPVFVDRDLQDHRWSLLRHDLPILDPAVVGQSTDTDRAMACDGPVAKRTRARIADPLAERARPGVLEAFKAVDVSIPQSLVSAPNGQPWFCGDLGEQSMFIRPCYQEFWDLVMEFYTTKREHRLNCAGCIFIGNPGIGKSCWLNYALIRLLQEDKTFLLERTLDGDRWLFKNGNCYHFNRVDACAFEYALELIRDDNDAFYLFDPDRTSSEDPTRVHAFTIVTSSPNNNHYKVFNKRLVSGKIDNFKRYFPCWTLEELQNSQVLLSKEEVLKRFEIWGGIPRYVFGTQNGLQQELEVRITSVDLELIERYRGTPEISSNDQSKLSHMLVQYRVESPYVRGELDFASARIAELIIDQKMKSDRTALIAHYESCRRQEWQGAYTGHLWEYLCHNLLPSASGGKGHKLQPLEPTATGKIILKRNSPMKVDRGRLDDLLSAVAGGAYFQPTAFNFPVIDSAAMEGGTVYGFQMTLASRHSLSGRGLSNILKKVGADKKFWLVWVVDPTKEGGLNSKQNIDMSEVSQADACLIENVVTQWKLEFRFPRESVRNSGCPG